MGIVGGHLWKDPFGPNISKKRAGFRCCSVSGEGFRIFRVSATGFRAWAWDGLGEDRLQKSVSDRSLAQMENN